MTKRMLIMLLATGAVFGVVFGIKGLFSYMMNKGINEAPPPVVAVSTTAVEADSWALSIGTVGSIRAVNGVELATEVEGTVAKILFRSGEAAEQGDVLVELDASADKAQLKALRAAARLAQQDYERFASLFRQGSVSRSELDRKESERDQAAATADAQAERVAKKTLRAPFSGQLGIRHVDQGQFVAPGTTVVSLFQMDPIFVNFSLPEQQLPLISEGLDVQVRLTSQPDEVFSGEITAIEPGVDTATRNFNVQATLANPDGKLRPGMFARVRIQLPNSEDVLVVPRTAISYAPYGNSVYVIAPAEDSEGEGDSTSLMAQKRLVKLGNERGDLVAITEGLEAGERVATSGLLKLRNGAPVKEENDVQPPADPTPNPDNS
ncbi:MAG: efflux RND transporter periplasmic adaptor subunit [Alcanivoracaceae bacterium]